MNTLKSVRPIWSTSYLGNGVDILNSKSWSAQTPGLLGMMLDIVRGEMIIRVKIRALPSNMNAETFLLFVLDCLLDRINACSSETAEIFEAQDIRLSESFDPTNVFSLTGEGEYVAKIEWRGEFPKSMDAWREMAFLTRRGV